MARVSLIVLRSPGISWPSERVAAYRAGLQELGYSVEVLVVSDPSMNRVRDVEEPWCETILAGSPGLAESAISGLRAAQGNLLVAIDLAMPYASEDVFAVVETLVASQAQLVVASRPKPWLGRLSLRFLGTTDPTSGLVGLTRAGALEADDSFAPVGSRFTLELLARVAGKRVDAPVKPVKAGPRRTTPFGDLRQLKRLADDRFGNASRLIQFCFVGASGMVVDLTFYALLQAIFSRTALAGLEAPVVGGSLALAVAGVIAIAIALTWNFSINRRLTFNDARRGSIGRQYLRYVLSNLLGIGVSLSLRLYLPNTFGFFERHRLAAALVGIVTATGISFSMARWFVFGHRPTSTPTSDRPVRPAKRRCAGFRPLIPPRLTSHQFEGSVASIRSSSENVTN
jgi:dolichol-phosphate mannosyltransferase